MSRIRNVPRRTDATWEQLTDELERVIVSVQDMIRGSSPDDFYTIRVALDLVMNLSIQIVALVESERSENLA